MADETLNLTILSDQALLKNTKELVKEESRTLTKILQHLAEIDRRRLYASLHCTSLFQYAVKHLGYSEDEAYRRINAMKLVRQMPEVEEKVQSGALTLSNLNLAQTFFRQEKIVATAKTELLARLENKSSREAQKIVAEERTSPPPPQERIRVVGPTTVEIKFTANEEVQEKNAQLKGLLAHKYPNLKLADLFEQLCDLGLRHWNPATFRKRCVKRVSLRKKVWARDGARCTQCKSHHALELDHIRPKAFGGDDTLENLRLLCRSCNQRAAIKNLGLKKMTGHMSLG